MQTPPLISKVLVNAEVLGLHLEDGRFISVPISFYPTLALATPEERSRFEISGSSVYWPKLDADIGVEGLLAGAREHDHYARKAAKRNAADMAARIEALQPIIAAQRASEVETMQKMQQFMLILAGAFGTIGLLVVLLMAYLQWRTVSRLVELSSLR